MKGWKDCTVCQGTGEVVCDVTGVKQATCEVGRVKTRKDQIEEAANSFSFDPDPVRSSSQCPECPDQDDPNKPKCKKCEEKIKGDMLSDFQKEIDQLKKEKPCKNQ